MVNMIMCVMGDHTVCVWTDARLLRFPVLQDYYGMPKCVNASLKTSATLTENWVCVWIVRMRVCVVCVLRMIIMTLWWSQGFWTQVWWLYVEPAGSWTTPAVSVCVAMV